MSHAPGMMAWPEQAEVDVRERIVWELPSIGFEDAGPGAEEIRAWAVVGAAAPPGAAKLLAYEAVDAWATGCAGVDLLPTAIRL